MANRKASKEQVQQVIEDAAYLQQEAEALKYVIDEVPYDTRPPEGHSIAELLMLIDHAQVNYYEPVIDDVLHKNRPTRLGNFTHYKETFNPDDRGEENIQEILHALANHRASLINKLKDISLNNWNGIIYKDNEEILLIGFIEKMNHLDQVYLKKITNLVQSYHQEKNTQRELKQRQRPNPENKEG